MSAPACYVIDAPVWAQMVQDVAWAFLFLFLLVWVRFDDAVFFCFRIGRMVRREARRRRIQRIRAARMLERSA